MYEDGPPWLVFWDAMDNQFTPEKLHQVCDALGIDKNREQQLANILHDVPAGSDSDDYKLQFMQEARARLKSVSAARPQNIVNAPASIEYDLDELFNVLATVKPAEFEGSIFVASFGGKVDSKKLADAVEVLLSIDRTIHGNEYSENIQANFEHIKGYLSAAELKEIESRFSPELPLGQIATLQKHYLNIVKQHHDRPEVQQMVKNSKLLDFSPVSAVIGKALPVSGARARAMVIFRKNPDMFLSQLFTLSPGKNPFTQQQGIMGAIAQRLLQFAGKKQLFGFNDVVKFMLNHPQHADVLKPVLDKMPNRIAGVAEAAHKLCSLSRSLSSETNIGNVIESLQDNMKILKDNKIPIPAELKAKIEEAIEAYDKKAGALGYKEVETEYKKFLKDISKKDAQFQKVLGQLDEMLQKDYAALDKKVAPKAEPAAKTGDSSQAKSGEVQHPSPRK